MTGAPIRIVAAADITATRRIGATGVARRADITRLLDSADVALGCFEVPLTDRGVPLDKQVLYRAEAGLAEEYRALGFRHISLANNHSLNYGPLGMADTVAAFDAVGVPCFGAGTDLPEAAEPLVVEADGATIGLLGVSCLLPTGTAADAERPGVNPLRIRTAYEVNANHLLEEPGLAPEILTWPEAEDLERILADVRRLRARVDVLAVAVHWGVGLAPELAQYQRPLGRGLVDAGADIVLGSHSRVLHGVERHGAGLILFSQGSFAAQMDGATRMPDDDTPIPGDGMLVEFELRGPGEFTARLYPTAVADDGVAASAEGEDLERILRRLEESTAGFGTSARRDGGVLVIDSEGSSHVG